MQELQPKQPDKAAAQDNYSNYFEYNKALRTWFVSFGLGALVLFMLHPDFVDVLKKTGHFSAVDYSILIACSLQIIIAWANKACSWYLYDADRKGISGCQLWIWLDNAFWIDVAIDLATMVLFGCAIWIMLSAFGV